jgi:multiple sugar transport system substrate-binding protein
MRTAVGARRGRLIGTAAAGTVLAAVLSTLSGCGVGSGTDGLVNLTMVAADYGGSGAKGTKAYWDDLVASFEHTHPDIAVHVKVYPYDKVNAEVAKMAAAGDPPDIAETSAFAHYAGKNQLYSAEQLLTIPTQADLTSSFAQAGQVKQVQYGLPFVATSQLFIYNKSMFQQAGLTSAPKTWAQTRKDAQALHDIGVQSPYGLGLSGPGAEDEAMLWAITGAGGYTDLDGNYTLDSQQNVDTIEWIKDNLVRPGLTNSAPDKTTGEQIDNGFLSGRVGMLYGDSTLFERAKRAGIDVGVAALPGRTGASEQTLGKADWMVAFKKHGHRAEIGDFLEDVYAKKNVLAFLDRYDYLPVTNSASVAMQADLKDSDLRLFLSLLPAGITEPVSKTSWGKVAGRIRKGIGVGVTSQDPAAVLGVLERDAVEDDATADKNPPPPPGA